MQNPRTIVLAVVSAKNDMANQIILSLFKKIDGNGSRTLGIITKPDCITDGDESWFDLAANKEIFLQRGWHMVKNRAETEMNHTFAARNEAEKAFFEKGRFKDIPRANVGIEALRARLSKLLHRHLVQELPSLKKEMGDKLKATVAELDDLGQRRETPQEQRMVLTKISTHMHQILNAAKEGQYVHEFFSALNSMGHFTDGKSVRRLRAVVQNLNQAFADNMRTRGHKYNITNNKSGVVQESKAATPNLFGLGAFQGGFAAPAILNSAQKQANAQEDDDMDDWLPKPQLMTHDNAMKWVKAMIRGCRGHELPGSINPQVTSHLYWEQSEPWKDIAEGHIEEVRAACKQFFHDILEYAAPAEFKKPLEDLIVNGVLADTLTAAQDELKKLLEDKAQPPQ